MTLRARIAAGDRAALGEAYVAYRCFARSVLRKSRWSLKRDLDDLLQETFLLLPEAARCCRPATTLAGCVATAALQTIRSFRCHLATSDGRGGGRRGSPGAGLRVELSTAALRSLPDSAPMADELLELREQTSRVTEVLPLLAARHRKVLLGLANGVTGKEMGRRLGVDPETVFRVASKARRRLRQLYVGSVA